LIKLKHDCYERCEIEICPFQVIQDYLSSIPDPYGQQTEIEKQFKIGLESLHFCRAMSSRGSRKDFTKNVLGIHNIRKSLENLNSRIPEALQVFFNIIQAQYT
jgi:hypothetical protein